MSTLSGKVAVVAGGSGVLGQAIASGFINAGAQCAITGTDATRASHAAAGLGAHDHVRGYRIDVREPLTVESACGQILSDFGRVDILVNAIGGNTAHATASADNNFFDMPIDAFADVVDLNLIHSTVRLCQVFGRHMKDNPGGGSIINISSMAADRPLTRIAAYSAAKAAVNNFTRWFAVYCAKECNPALRVNAIAPGFFLADQNRFLLTDADTGKLTDRGQSIVDHTPAGRMGNPDELVSTAVWLASDASRFVTGAIIPVDGGFSAYSGV